MKLVKRDNMYMLECTYDERMTAKNAGMRWNATTKCWHTNNVNVAKKLIQKERGK